MFTPADREIFAEEALKKERLEKIEIKERTELAKQQLKTRESIIYERNKFIINVLLNNFEDYFELKESYKTFFFRKISEKWKMKWNIMINGPDQTGLVLNKLLNSDLSFKLMLIQQLKLLGWDIELGFNAWEITLTQTTKHKFLTFIKNLFQKAHKQKVPAQLSGPYRTLSNNNNEPLKEINSKSSLFTGFWPLG